MQRAAWMSKPGHQGMACMELRALTPPRGLDITGKAPDFPREIWERRIRHTQDIKTIILGPSLGWLIKRTKFWACTINRPKPVWTNPTNESLPDTFLLAHGAKCILDADVFANIDIHSNKRDQLTSLAKARRCSVKSDVGPASTSACKCTRTT